MGYTCDNCSKDLKRQNAVVTTSVSITDDGEDYERDNDIGILCTNCYSEKGG